MDVDVHDDCGRQESVDELLLVELDGDGTVDELLLIILDWVAAVDELDLVELDGITVLYCIVSYIVVV